MGGRDDHLQTLNDCLILNLSSLTWYQVNVHVHHMTHEVHCYIVY